MAIHKRTGSIGMSEEVRLARRTCIGGSDAKIIMSGDQKAIEQLWLVKRGESEPGSDDLSDVLIVQMGNVTEALNTDWFEHDSGFVVTAEQSRPSYADWPVAMSTLDGLVHDRDGAPANAVFEAKFMMPFHWTPEKAVTKYFPQVQHNMLVTGMPKCWLSVITGGGTYFRTLIDADFFYQMEMLEAEKQFWDAVQSGRYPGAADIAAPEIKLEHDQMRIVSMIGNNHWAALAADLSETLEGHAKHEKAKKEIKELIPEDAKEAIGHGVRITKAKNGNLTVKIEKAAKIKPADNDNAAEGDGEQKPKRGRRTKASA